MSLVSDTVLQLEVDIFSKCLDELKIKEYVMTPEVVYTIGVSVAVFMALCWSFVLDKKKPPTLKEFLAKFVARALFIIAIFSALMGFLYLAFGVFRQ